MKRIVIAIDGPAGSGKTTSARFLAERLNYIYIDTGAMYRAVTLATIRLDIATQESKICEMMKSIKIDLIQSENGQRTMLNGEDVSEQIRLPEVTKLVSPVSAVACVRDVMVAQQREIGKSGGVVMDGRDIGTVVFPQAELKVFLVASDDARAARRAKEMREKGIDCNFEEIKEQILYRDKFDSSRENSPLKKAEDAIEIDTSDLTIDEQTNIIYNIAINRIANAKIGIY